MVTLFAMYSTHLCKFFAVLLMLCLAAKISTAQLEFSNWVVGKNSVLHIEPDGRASIIKTESLVDDDYALLSDSKGNVVTKIALNPVRFNDCNGKTIFSEGSKSHTAPPFLFKSPDSEYVYILHNTYSHELTDINLVTRKTQLRCFCKKISDDSDEGQDIMLHEEILLTDARDWQYITVDRPFYCALSCSDGKSVWILMKGQSDRFVIIKLRGGDIENYKIVNYDLPNLFIASNGTKRSIFTTADDGKIYCAVADTSTSKQISKTLCLFFDQTEGNILGYKMYDISAPDSEITTNGKYLYYHKGTNEIFIYRQEISDMDNGVYNEELISNDITAFAPRQQNIRIGPDGNIYVISGKSSISVIYDSESDNPRIETLFTDIPDAKIWFPTYLRTKETFYFTVDCDKSVSFHYYDKKNEVKYHHWDFGDGNSSDAVAPQHYYAKTGVYDVTLKLFLKNGQQKILPSRKITIKELEKPKIICE